jgi:hypothetical protein
MTGHNFKIISVTQSLLGNEEVLVIPINIYWKGSAMFCFASTRFVI